MLACAGLAQSYWTDQIRLETRMTVLYPVQITVYDPPEAEIPGVPLAPAPAVPTVPSVPSAVVPEIQQPAVPAESAAPSAPELPEEVQETEPAAAEAVPAPEQDAAAGEAETQSEAALS